jgi:hypothetical protein
MICARCGRWMSGQEHVDQCGAICLAPMSSEGCVLSERPDWAVLP